MNLRTKSIYPYAGSFQAVDIFGYVSHGVPGLEIVGLGKHSRGIKEKFIFLTRDNGLRIPKRRYVICLDDSVEGKKFKEDEFRYLELPMLLLFWTLAGNLPFMTLEDCFCSGKVNLKNEVDCLNLSFDFQSNLKEFLSIEDSIDLKFITSEKMDLVDELYHISVEGIMRSIREYGLIENK